MCCKLRLFVTRSTIFCVAKSRSNVSRSVLHSLYRDCILRGTCVCKEVQFLHLVHTFSGAKSLPNISRTIFEAQNSLQQQAHQKDLMNKDKSRALYRNFTVFHERVLDIDLVPFPWMGNRAGRVGYKVIKVNNEAPRAWLVVITLYQTLRARLSWIATLKLGCHAFLTVL